LWLFAFAVFAFTEEDAFADDLDLAGFDFFFWAICMKVWLASEIIYQLEVQFNLLVS
jgi:hypothetical protein